MPRAYLHDCEGIELWQATVPLIDYMNLRAAWEEVGAMNKKCTMRYGALNCEIEADNGAAG